MAPVFLWQKPRPAPVYRHDVLRTFFIEWEPNLQRVVDQGLLRALLGAAHYRFDLLWQTFLGPALLIPLAVMSPWVVRDSRMRLPLIFSGVMAAGMSLQRYVLPHYFGPSVGLVFLLLVQSFRHLSQAHWGRWRFGHWLTRGAITVAIVTFAAHIFCVPVEKSYDAWNVKRMRLLKKLSTSGQHLVLVRYSPGHNIHHEWVYNLADIDRSTVVWAHDHGRA